MALVSKAFQDIITFSRASSGTYVNSNGYITNSSVLNYLTYSNQPENAAWTKSNSFVQQNLLTYSQEFDNAAWTKVAVTCAGAEINATIAPDGTLTADKVSEDGTLSTHWVFENITTTAAPYTASFYFKAAERSWAFIRIRDSGGNDRFAWFNLSAGTVGTVQTNLTATISAANNGFYRCVATVSAALAGSNPIVAGIATADNISSYTGTVGSGIYMWGAQLVQGSVPGDYRATTSAALPCLYADYNGALRARKFCEAATTGTHSILQNNTITGGVIATNSIYVKAAERTACRVINYDNAASYAVVYVNLSNGSIITSGIVGTVSSQSFSVEPAENGWYRISVAASLTSTARQLRVDTAVGGSENTTGDGSSGIYIADAQLNDGSSALAYYDTTQYAYNAPRFDYDPVTLAAKGLLVEEQRANLLFYSNAFTTAPWAVGTNTNMTAASALSPDGTVNAWKLYASNGLTSAGLLQSITKAASALTYAASIYAKAAGQNWLQIAVFDGTNGNRYWFNVSTGAVGTTAAIGAGFTGVSASIVPAGNGFYRCVLVATSSAVTTYSVYFYPALADGNNGTGDASGNGVHIFGSQLE